MWLRTTVLLVCTFFLAEAGRFKKQGHKHLKTFNQVSRRNVSSNFGLWPSSFNLATKAIISANATCGENGREEFCRMLEGGKGRCGICDNFSTDPGKKHPISYAIDGTHRWWQSPALFYGSKYEYVTITIDLKQIYQITDIIIKSANSLRPGTWILERSLEGKNYEPWQYFARNDKECFERFGIPGTKGKPHYFTDTEIICTSFYSKLTPMENGEIHTSLINGRPGANESSPELLEFTKARYVRLRLMGLRGTVEPLPYWFSQDILKEKKLFYTIRDISIVGYCVCNGHAENCRHNVASGHPECECAHHTCGPNCDRCCPMYNQRQWGPGSSRDARQCLPCNCHGHATSCHYDESVDKAGLSMDINGNYQGGGVCDNCTAHTTGINCERCLPGYYRPYGTVIYADKPCLKCDCELPGSAGTCTQEGEQAGNCHCLPGYEGEKCDKCAKGFKGWPSCEPCPCDPRGAQRTDDCEGDCLCKDHVEGKFCDRCKSGFFALRSENPDGCTPCYCSGMTNLCEAATGTPKQIQTLENWLTTNQKISEVSKPIWDFKGIFSMGSYEFSTSESLYWLAPEVYLSNKLEYYGSVFLFKVHWVIMRGDTSGKPTMGPNMIIVGPNGLKIAHGNESLTVSNATFEIRLKESNWYHLDSNLSVSRSEFLRVLSNISHILLRATFHTDQIESLLEEATMRADSQSAHEVEKCLCPSGYAGLSCEMCAFGHVRIETNAESYCAKCDCNGHSETCNPDTGECFCQHNTTGENCERCKPGFYGNPLRGTKEACKKCACPLENDENNFSPSCQLDYLNEDSEEESYVCTQCPKGYTGDHCEICDDGYFGNPMELGNVCKPCDCNGSPCDKVTGQCLNCKGNTEGWRCEKCKPGYYGDALMSNCIPCQCDTIGSLSKNCDQETGQCQCRERFTERTCNTCEPGYGNVTGLCVACACNKIGSTSPICDQHTGLCDCKPGVDGFYCDACQNAYYGLSETGCKARTTWRFRAFLPGKKSRDADGGLFRKQNAGCFNMRTNVLLVVSVVLLALGGVEPRRNHLRNFYSTLDEHERNTELFLQNAKIRHSERKAKKAQRCRRYAQLYYQNYSNCYYTFCRQSYCGYCPTSNCRRRCPYDCETTPTPVKECNCDEQGSKIQACDPITGQCQCKPHYIGPKCDKCKPGYWKTKSGCAPCNCNYNGSTSLNCNPQTGLCPCKPGVEGRNCDTCKDKHYGNVATGCKICDPCEKPGHICHPETGKCVCPPLTTGTNCDRCVANAYNLEPGKVGCKPCDCSKTGSSNQQCDESGRCSCKTGFEGEKCNRCTFDYYNYPNCRKCGCDIGGTRPEECINGLCKCSQDGCKCKANVEGRHCNKCKVGTFGIFPTHIAGCLDCFCSNRSTKCSASRSVWEPIRSTNVRKLPPRECVNKISCWQLPDKFHGDLIRSYGGYLRLSTNESGHFNVYLTGNGVTLESVSNPSGYVNILETSWKLKFNTLLPYECHGFLTRPCLLVVLQNVTQIQLEHKPPTGHLTFHDVVIDKESNLSDKTHEQCLCPNKYTSSSCQDPSTGYYRYYPKETEPGFNYIDRIIGVAKPCQCNNRSNTCDKNTGHCLNCTDSTTGPHCELCAEGHYMDPSGKCLPCLCPSESQNFAQNCTPNGRHNFICICKRGYSGHRCDKCENDYWGNPQAGGTCQPCNCNAYGSESLKCDKTTGQCKCKPGFTGEKCSKCSSSRNVIQDGVCVPCDECTQILFHTIDELSNSLNDTLDSVKGGIGPPWTRLKEINDRHNIYSYQFDNLETARKLINEANIPEMEKRVEKINQNLPKRNEILSEQTKIINEMSQEAQTLSKTVQELDDRVNTLIENVNGFGKSQVDVNEALREAKEILDEITDIANEAPLFQYDDVFKKCQKLLDDVNQIYANEINTSEVEKKLAELRHRLTKLRKLLDNTERTNQLAQTKNEQNRKRIRDVQDTLERINAHNYIVTRDIEDALRKINATNDLLNDLETIYQLLAKTDLENATKDLENDELDELYDTLSSVRDHVRKLQDKVKFYKTVFNFTSEEWTKINASASYDNIVKGIEEARREAKEARDITLKALEKLYPPGDDSLNDKTNLAKAFSDRIQKRILNLKNLSDEFAKTSELLEDLKRDILFNGKNNNELNAFLRDIQKDIRNQSDVISKLKKSKNDARNVSSMIASIEQRVKDTNISLQYELTKSYYNYLNLTSARDIAKLMERVKKTRKELENINVSLNNTATDQAKDLNANKFKSTDNNLKMIQEQIEQLTKKIRDANERVESVDYGVNITKCERLYKVQNDIFRSLKIRFKCKTCNLFEISNSRNQRISLHYEDETVLVTWNGHNASIGSSNLVSIQRTGTNTLRIDSDKGRKTLSNIAPFFIEDTHPLKIGNFEKNNSTEAAIHRIILNGQTIGLWKFNQSKGQCLGFVQNTSNDGLEDVFFAGNGYRHLQKDSLRALNPTQLNFKFYFSTFDENSLLFVAQDTTNISSFVALNLVEGKVELKVRHVDGTSVTLTSKGKYNNAKDTTVEVTMLYGGEKQTYALNVLTSEEEPQEQSRVLTKANVYKIKKSEVFIGGVSSSFKDQIPIDTTSFLGNLKVSSEKLVVISQNSFSYNIEPQLQNLELNKTWFSGYGFVNLRVPASYRNFAFHFRPVHVENHFVMNLGDEIDVYLDKAHLIFKTASSELPFQTPICVNSSYFVNINATSVSVNGNEMTWTQPLDDPKFRKVYLGAYKTNNRRNFSGSIRDIFIDDRPVTFNTNTVKSFARVQIGRDHPETLQTKSECMNFMQNTERYFRTPDYKTEPQAFKFGDKSNSYVFIKNTFGGKKLLMEFQFRTFYPNGLLFLAHSLHKNLTFYTVLEVHGGDIRLRVQGHKPKKTNMTNRLNDGLWHHVLVEQILGKKRWRIIVKVDKKWKVKDRTQRNNFNGDFYFGGVSEHYDVHKKLRNELLPFRGCIRSLKINKNLQVVKNNNNVFYNNIGQCFQNVEEGAYFGGDAYAIYKYDFKVDKYLELGFEFKTGEPNGILLSVSNPGNSPALSVELQSGAVVMTIDMGNGIISKVTNSPHSDATLANNEWHNLTALYSSFELTVNVDGVRKSWVQSDVNSMVDEIEAPLYIGGLPINAPSGTLKIKENFKGCIRKFKIGDALMDWTDMKELNNVQINSCLV
ncbi:Laminin subunit alpha-1-like Protein [Tribolium castaneum]|uniref:Laminin subunit alpha-1-like Protein n=1 Tax=Tribolium castaneum TaxID=7070 RepID=A0A139WHZ5_TRICA|nr:Laminin subunit alpha-1-like Protein [Tribolium castaneum]